MNSIVLVKNQSVITTSILVAEKFERNHRDILRAIKKLDCSQEFNERNFALVEYVDAKGEKRPMYQNFYCVDNQSSTACIAASQP
jgi:Rha family phage regulatory protein